MLPKGFLEKFLCVPILTDGTNPSEKFVKGDQSRIEEIQTFREWQSLEREKS